LTDCFPSIRILLNILRSSLVGWPSGALFNLYEFCIVIPAHEITNKLINSLGLGFSFGNALLEQRLDVLSSSVATEQRCFRHRLILVFEFLL